VELNPKVYIITALIIFIILISGLPFILIKQTYFPDVQINVTPNETPIIIYKYINVTPTPDNGIYYSPESASGWRKLGRYFVFHRNNVSGFKDLDFHVTVYDYKILDSYHWYNVHDAKTYTTIPDSVNDKFLFIFVQIYTDDLSGEDVRPYLPAEQHFQILYNNTMYAPIPFDKTIRDIYEFKDMTNKNGDSTPQYYGQFVKQDITKSGVLSSVPLFYIMGGKSNAIDGFIIYSIPKNASINDLYVYGDFFNYGNSQWVFKT
jgi:hypothetical protein